MRSEGEQSQANINDLPMHVLDIIFMKLPSKSIGKCKIVLKSWNDWISSPDFVRMHLAQSPGRALTRLCWNIRRSFYLFEDGDHIFANEERPKPMTVRLKIPLRDPKCKISALLDAADDVIVKFYTGHAADHKYTVANTCNGLLCLYSPDHRRKEEPIVICNPLTGDFVKISNTGHCTGVVGFGFCPEEKKYKIVRVCEAEVNRHRIIHIPRSEDTVFEIHTVGTESWRSLDTSAIKPGFLSRSPACLKGRIYWLRHASSQDQFAAPMTDNSIICLHLNEERFEVIFLPFEHRQATLSAQENCLYLSTLSAAGVVDIWKSVNDVESWVRLFSVDVFEIIPAIAQSWTIGFNFVSCTKEGMLIMFEKHQNGFVYYDLVHGGLRLEQLGFEGRVVWFEYFHYNPSFTSLKDIAGPGNIEVLNVYSRCGRVLLAEEQHCPNLGVLPNRNILLPPEWKVQI